MADIPQAGEPLNMKTLDMIIEAVETRHQNFPEEPGAMTLGLVLANIGDRFTPVACINGEWEGIKRDIPKNPGIPKCPNGHVMTQGRGLVLGWMLEAE